MSIKSYNSKILLTNSLTTGLRFVKKANLDGTKLMNYNIYTPVMLVKEKIIKLMPNTRIISDDESAYLLLLLIQQNDYDLKQYVTSFGAAKKLLEVINDYRFHENNQFTNLIKAKYADLLKDYQGKLKENNLLDYIEALSQLLNKKQGEECYMLDDLNLRPLEIKVFSSMYQTIEKAPLKEKDYHVSAIYKSYGQYNEVVNLLKYIEDNKIKVGDVEVLYSDAIYENIIKGVCSSRKIPYTLKCNHAKSSNFVSFIVDILNYYKNDYKYELLSGILSNQGLPSEYLKQFNKTSYFPRYVVGFSKDRTLAFINTYENDYPKEAEGFKDFLKLLKDIVSITDNDQLDFVGLVQLACQYIEAKNEIDALSNEIIALNPLVSLETNFDKKVDLILDLLNNLTYNEGDSDNKISFSKISKTFTLRKLIFVLGCNQTLLVGSDIENAFIEDVDAYQKELSNDTNIHTVLYQRDAIIDNLKYFLRRSDADVVLSYSYYDKVNLKEMTEGVRLIGGAGVKHTDSNLYYEVKTEAQFINKLNQVDEEIKPGFDNGVVNPIESTKQQESKEDDSSTVQPIITPKKIYTLSPTDAGILIECPFKFYYKKVYNLPDVRFPALDESTWLEANTKGTMFHEIMEIYFKHFINVPINTFDQNVFEDAYQEALNNAIAANPISNAYVQNKEAEELKDASEKYLREIVANKIFDKYKVLACEYKLSNLNCVYKQTKNGKSAGFLFTGTVDRVDGYVDNNVLHLRIVDYKSGKAKEKPDNNYYQHILYSYVLMKALPKNSFGLSYKDVVVDEFVYSFTLRGNIDLIYNNSEIKQGSPDYDKVFNAIEGILLPYLNDETGFLDILNNAYQKLHPDAENDACEYCTFVKMCPKKIEWGV